jgi:hypothetical protein
MEVCVGRPHVGRADFRTEASEIGEADVRLRSENKLGLRSNYGVAVNLHLVRLDA